MAAKGFTEPSIHAVVRLTLGAQSMTIISESPVHPFHDHFLEPNEMALTLARPQTLARSLTAIVVFTGLLSISGCGGSTDATVLEPPSATIDAAAEAKKREELENFDPTKEMKKKR